LSHPVIKKGVVVDSKVVAIYGSRKRTVIKAPVVEFEYGSKKYHIIGGWDAQKGLGIKTSVIFNASTPENGAEFTVLGLLDFRLFRIAFIIWLFLSGGLYALVTLDKHFSLFDVDFKKMTVPRFLLIAILLLILPLLKDGKTWILGTKTEGLVTNESMRTNDGSMHWTVIFKANNKEYKLGATGEYDGSDMFGKMIPIKYNPDNPDNACIDDIVEVYSNKWNILTGLGLMFLTAWYFATRSIDEE
jgi:hypothetical protein